MTRRNGKYDVNCVTTAFDAATRVNAKGGMRTSLEVVTQPGNGGGNPLEPIIRLEFRDVETGKLIPINNPRPPCTPPQLAELFGVHLLDRARRELKLAQKQPEDALRKENAMLQARIAELELDKEDAQARGLRFLGELSPKTQ